MAYVCLNAGFKFALADDRPSSSTAQLQKVLRLLPLMCAIMLSLASVAVAASPLPARPAGAGADSPRLPAERLQRLDGFLRDATDAHGYLGAVSLVVRDGIVVQSQAYGHRNLARSSPMRTDSIFRIYSMTKTVTTVAVLMLMEEGQAEPGRPRGEIPAGVREHAGLRRRQRRCAAAATRARTRSPCTSC